MSFFRQHAQLFTTAGAGLFIGIIYWRMTSQILRELQRLTSALAEMQAEIASIKDKVENSRRRRRPASGFFTASSGDDDEDVYEEAYGGSDMESLKELEEQILRTGSQNQEAEVGEGRATNSREEIFREVDTLLEGGDEQKRLAYDILNNNRHLYSFPREEINFEIDTVLEGPDEQKKRVYDIQNNNRYMLLFLTDADFHWRLSKTTFQLSQIEGAQGNVEKRKEYVYTAKDLAQTALALDDTCANAHKWFAITIGSVGEYEGTQERIKNGFIYKEHIEKAIAINPTDPSNHYLLGRWCYSVYMLSWLERKAAATLFATPPSATIDETLKHFLKAEELNPGKWKENILFIAKCYLEMRQYKEMKDWLKLASQVPVVSQDDKTAQTEIVDLLSKYQNY